MLDCIQFNHPSRDSLAECLPGHSITWADKQTKTFKDSFLFFFFAPAVEWYVFVRLGMLQHCYACIYDWMTDCVHEINFCLDSGYTMYSYVFMYVSVLLIFMVVRYFQFGCWTFQYKLKLQLTKYLNFEWLRRFIGVCECLLATNSMCNRKYSMGK